MHVYSISGIQIDKIVEQVWMVEKRKMLQHKVVTIFV